MLYDQTEPESGTLSAWYSKTNKNRFNVWKQFVIMPHTLASTSTAVLTSLERHISHRSRITQILWWCFEKSFIFAVALVAKIYYLTNAPSSILGKGIWRKFWGFCHFCVNIRLGRSDRFRDGLRKPHQLANTHECFSHGRENFNYFDDHHLLTIIAAEVLMREAITAFNIPWWYLQVPPHPSHKRMQTWCHLLSIFMAL